MPLSSLWMLRVALPPQGGFMSMRAKLLAGATFVASVLMATAAWATITYPPEGGTWDHGTGTGYTWSDYYHSSDCHGSTAVGVRTVRSPNTNPGSWSRASVAMSSFNNETYYRIEAGGVCP
ncbi:lactococcin 972 family bacteriocin [Streptosporangium sp. NPDC006007]|uniref:lactococcin 972 family bacteriocin n=1 Tax=Streptosporangium sp. NPDC006007 TaxID=3154575 RepID=UPI00339DE845